jgi:hypothetical protein
MGLQFTLTGVFKKLFLGDDHRSMAPWEELSSATLGGAVSAIYTSPVELAMIQQQNFGGSLVVTVGRVLGQKGIFQG